MGHNSFLKNVSIAPTDKTDGKNPNLQENFQNLLALWTYIWCVHIIWCECRLRVVSKYILDFLTSLFITAPIKVF